MSASLDAIPEAEIDRLRELAHIGASWAATAFARIVGRTILTRVPVVHGAERFEKRGSWQTGILCDMEGSLNGVVAIMLPDSVRDAMMPVLCGRENPPLESVASALSEFGNILASQTVSAIADTMGGRIIPGLPELVLQNAETALHARMSPRYGPPPPIYIESELFDRQGDFRALHVLIPRISKVAASAR
jgi:chemotaxis protein CheY-P-specific phosphatase CheC